MVKIERPADLEFTNIPLCIKLYLKKYIQLILVQYQVGTLRKIGCIYFLEEHQDMSQYREMGLRLPLQKTPFEYGEQIFLKGSHGGIELLHACYLFNNDFIVDIFGERKIFSPKAIRSMLDT